MRRLLDGFITGLCALGLVLLCGVLPIPRVTLHAQIDNQDCLPCQNGGGGGTYCSDAFSALDEQAFQTGETYDLTGVTDYGVDFYGYDWKTYYGVMHSQGGDNTFQFTCYDSSF